MAGQEAGLVQCIYFIITQYKSNGPVLACWGQAQSRVPQKLVISVLILVFSTCC